MHATDQSEAFPAPPGLATKRAGPRFSWADLIGPLSAATVAIATSLWFRENGPESLTTLDSAFGSLANLTGLLAADLMLLQVLMLARIPWVERAWGHDLLARRHRLVAYTSFWLLIAHVVLFTAQRLYRAGGWDATTVYELFVRESWLLAATVGTIMLIVVTVTSIRWARRRLRYESWHLLHLYSYLGLALALPHQVVDGADFHGAFPQTYWWSLWGVSAAAIVVFRLVIPVYRSLRHRLRVSSVEVEGPGVVSVNITGRHLDRLRTKSGQFFIWRFLEGPGWSRGNPYTLSAAPTEDHLRVTIQAEGDGSERAAGLTPGTGVLIEGPYGSMTAERRTHSRMLLMAAGVGITPIRALLEDSPYGPGEATLIYRFSGPAQAILTDEIERIAATRGATVHLLPGPRRDDGSWLPAWAPAGKSDEDALVEMVPDVADRDIFVCGPPAWIKSVQRAARAAGAKRNQTHTEDFAW